MQSQDRTLTLQGRNEGKGILGLGDVATCVAGFIASALDSGGSSRRRRSLSSLGAEGKSADPEVFHQVVDFFAAPVRPSLLQRYPRPGHRRSIAQGPQGLLTVPVAGHLRQSWCRAWRGCSGSWNRINKLSILSCCVRVPGTWS